ncbi:hypothetical protein GBA52_010409 [Prunus armeniaca]|nr:hypothetical protein GBA52_010339 [Prunus armeniaca]KAH0983232.1 hypothetical protein GBA52_010409 [Prunus armeniaca]
MERANLTLPCSFTIPDYHYLACTNTMIAATTTIARVDLSLYTVPSFAVITRITCV